MRLNSVANQIKCAKQQIHLHVNMAETLLNCFAVSEGLFLDVVEK